MKADIGVTVPSFSNTSVNRVSTRVIHNTYHKTVVYRSDS